MYRNKEQRDFARTLRNQSTNAEQRLWHFLRTQKLRGHKFRRQAAIGSYIVDFACFSAKLVIELDGPQHLESGAAWHDERRTNWLASRGFQIIRFRNQELDESVHAVIDAIEHALAEVDSCVRVPPSPPRGAGISEC
jgi:very-short-patch-repair endonuclease